MSFVNEAVDKIIAIRAAVVSVITSDEGINNIIPSPKSVKEEDGNIFNPKELPGAEVILVDSGPGEKKENHFEYDNKFNLAVRWYTGKTNPVQGKNELIYLAESTKALLLQNYRLNDACRDLKWVHDYYSGKVTTGEFGAATRYVDVLFNCYELLPRNAL